MQQFPAVTAQCLNRDRVAPTVHAQLLFKSRRRENLLNMLATIYRVKGTMGSTEEYFLWFCRIKDHVRRGVQFIKSQIQKTPSSPAEPEPAPFEVPPEYKINSSSRRLTSPSANSGAKPPTPK